MLFDGPTANLIQQEQEIERRLLERLGFEVTTFLRSIADLSAIIANDPFGGGPSPGRRTNALRRISGGAADIAPVIERIHSLAGPTDGFGFWDRHLYWQVHGRISDSKVTGTRLEKFLGQPTTMRNVRTLERLIKKGQRE